MKKVWNKYYQELQLDEIPWQSTQADWFKELIDSGKVSPISALDLGCGTGKKSIYLAEHGCKKVVGVDVSDKAIEYAKLNLSESSAGDKITFYVHDATDLSFLKDETFDLILDWALFHGLVKNRQLKYIEELVKHSTRESYLILRVFSKRNANNQKYFIAKIAGLKHKIYLFDKDDIQDLFGKYFTIVETNQSLPRVNVQFSFDEYLMKRL